jgi:hypothetical protein
VCIDIHTLVTLLNIKFYENPFNSSRVVSCVQADRQERFYTRSGGLTESAPNKGRSSDGTFRHNIVVSLRIYISRGEVYFLRVQNLNNKPEIDG